MPGVPLVLEIVVMNLIVMAVIIRIIIVTVTAIVILISLLPIPGLSKSKKSTKSIISSEEPNSDNKAEGL